MTTHPPEPKPRRKWHLAKWLVLLAIAALAYTQWRAHTFNSALKEAEALGWYVVYTEPYAEIRKDWKSAFKKETWLDGVTRVGIPAGKELEQHHGLVYRLNPMGLTIYDSEALRNFSSIKSPPRLKYLRIESAYSLTNLDALQNLTALEEIYIADAQALTNLDGLKNLLAVKIISLSDAKMLTNVNGLKGLLELQYLELHRCTGLTNVDGLKNHKALQTVNLIDCPGLTNVDGLKNLPALKLVGLFWCTGLTKESVEALKATIPNTKVHTDEPSPFPKPNELDTPPGARDTDR